MFFVSARRWRRAVGPRCGAPRRPFDAGKSCRRAPPAAAGWRRCLGGTFDKRTEGRDRPGRPAAEGADTRRPARRERAPRRPAARAGWRRAGDGEVASTGRAPGHGAGEGRQGSGQPGLIRRSGGARRRPPVPRAVIRPRRRRPLAHGRASTWTPHAADLVAGPPIGADAGAAREGGGRRVRPLLGTGRHRNGERGHHRPDERALPRQRAGRGAGRGRQSLPRSDKTVALCRCGASTKEPSPCSAARPRSAGRWTAAAGAAPAGARTAPPPREHAQEFQPIERDQGNRDSQDRQQDNRCARHRASTVAAVRRCPPVGRTPPAPGGCGAAPRPLSSAPAAHHRPGAAAHR